MLYTSKEEHVREIQNQNPSWPMWSYFILVEEIPFAVLLMNSTLPRNLAAVPGHPVPVSSVSAAMLRIAEGIRSTPVKLTRTSLFLAVFSQKVLNQLRTIEQWLSRETVTFGSFLTAA